MSRAAVEYRWAPVRSEPVNATLRTRGCSTSGCPASGAESRDYVHHAFREACQLDQLDELQRRGRGVLRRLEHHGVAGCESGTELPGHEHQRGVPRDDPDANSERLVPGEGEGRLVGVNDGALDLVCEPGVIVIDARNVAKLRRHLAEKLAVVADLELAEPLRRSPPPDSASRRRSAPRRDGCMSLHCGRIECPVRGLDCPVGVLRVSSGDESPGSGGEGVEALEVLP